MSHLPGGHVARLERGVPRGGLRRLTHASPRGLTCTLDRSMYRRRRAACPQGAGHLLYARRTRASLELSDASTCQPTVRCLPPLPLTAGVRPAGPQAWGGEVVTSVPWHALVSCCRGDDQRTVSRHSAARALVLCLRRHGTLVITLGGVGLRPHSAARACLRPRRHCGRGAAWP